MSTHRPIDSEYNPSNEMMGTSLLSGKPETVRLPRNLSKEVKAGCRAILKDAPYIDQTQVDMLIRLVKLRLQLADIQSTLDREGLLQTNRFGDSVAHAGISAQSSICSALEKLERALCITVVARRQNISKAELNRAKAKQAMHDEDEKKDRQAAAKRTSAKLRLA